MKKKTVLSPFVLKSYDDMRLESIKKFQTTVWTQFNQWIVMKYVIEEVFTEWYQTEGS